MALTEREVCHLERIKEKLQRHKSEIKDAQRALRRLEEAEADFNESPIALGLELCPETIVDDLDLFIDDITSAIEQIDTAIEEFDG